MNIMLDEGAIMPTRAHKQDAGLDLYTPHGAYLWPGDSTVIDTGVHVEIPEGYVGMLKSKSGLNTRYGICGEGVVDAGYTGSIRAKLYNHGERPYGFKKGDKIIQLVLLPIITPELTLVDSFEETERGDGGFGSTGR